MIWPKKRFKSHLIFMNMTLPEDELIPAVQSLQLYRISKIDFQKLETWKISVKNKNKTTR